MLYYLEFNILLMEKKKNTAAAFILINEIRDLLRYSTVVKPQSCYKQTPTHGSHVKYTLHLCFRTGLASYKSLISMFTLEGSSRLIRTP